MSAPKIIHELVEAFRKDESAYIRKEYSEARARAEFIDPFLKALGWHPGENPEYIEEWKDCIVETSLEMENEAHRKRADYTCRIGKTPVLVIEAKKPQKSLLSSNEPALQIRSYAYTLQLPVGVLTNFQHLAIYDGRIKPKYGDKPNVARLEMLEYEEYVEKWDLIESLLGKEAIQRGAQREHIQKRVAKGLIPVGQAILAEIERWREELAQTMARKNKHLSEEELDFAVGRTIDRILFLRVSEARGIEPEQQLLNLCKGAGVYGRLIERYHEADARYNSGLFYFSSEKDRSEKPDGLTLTLEIEDRPLRQIIEGLYFPQNLYNYAQIPVEILGQVYEQFLGKQIVLKARHVADVVDKPEVRKAGGVYYTPSYIVDYIVEHTVGKLLGGKTPKAIEKLRIVDPACGSGSFLLGAYQYLLDWYLTWYKKDGPTKHQREICEDIQEGYRLTLRERKRILLAHIFGVDIDAQAVEVTKLSLLLKVLEGETQESIQQELKLRERALPDLGKNIQCGNSLIGTDFYKDHAELSDEERKKINPFDWKKAFPAVFKDGGFDAVIGNPPYVRQETLGHQFKEYAKANYEVYNGIADLYAYFVERSHRLLRAGGRFGMICSNKWMRSNYGAPLREFIARKTTIHELVDFGELKVFQDAATFPAIVLTINQPAKKQEFVYAPIKRLDFDSLKDEVAAIGLKLDNRAIGGYNWALASKEELDIIENMKTRGVPLGKYVNNQIYRGVLTGINEAFVIDGDTRKRLIKADKKSAELIKPFVVGDDVRKYHVKRFDRWLIFMPKGFTNDRMPSGKNPWRWFSQSYPAIAEHFAPFKERAGKRQDKGDYWWELRACDYYWVFDKPKIVYPEIAKESRFTLDSECLYPNKTLFSIPSSSVYLLGILNSKLTWMFLKRLCSVLGDADKSGRLLQQMIYIEQIPIRTINFSDKSDKARHDKMVKLVERMLKLHKDAQEEWVGTKQEAIEREIRATDEAIDRLVYELYGLTEEEIGIVEGEKEKS